MWDQLTGFIIVAALAFNGLAEAVTAPVLDSLFNKVAWMSATLLKRDSNTGVVLLIEICKNSFFHRTPPVAASDLQSHSSLPRKQCSFSQIVW